jgi:hypothetical protein
MGAERRRDPRIRCHLPCILRIGGSSFEGKVRNVSASGLAVAAETPALEQGDAVGVTLRTEGLAIELRALVWHVRSPGRSSGEKAQRTLGLVLSESAPEFARLVERLGAKTPGPAQDAGAAIQRSSPGAIVHSRGIPARREPAAPAREYRIRIKQTSGPRTCQIVASGTSKQAAIDTALREVGQGWIVLEVALIA